MEHRWEGMNISEEQSATFFSLVFSLDKDTRLASDIFVLLLFNSITLPGSPFPCFHLCNENSGFLIRQSYKMDSRELSNLLFLINLFIYLFNLAALGLRCCAWTFSSCSKRGLLVVALHGLLIVVASPVAEQGSRYVRVKSCGTQAQ